MSGIFYENFTMQETKHYKGVKLASGQEILSRNLVMEPSPTLPSVSFPLECGASETSEKSNPEEKVARGICITSSSLQKDLSNILVIFPPRCKI